MSTTQTTSSSESTKKNRKSDPNKLRLDIYISRLLKTVHKDVSIGKGAKDTLNMMIQYVTERILGVTQDLVQLSNRKTIGAREVQSGVIIILPGELAKHSVSEATRSLGKFTGSDGTAPSSGTREKPVSKSSRAGLVFPVTRIGNFMKYKTGNYRQGAGGPIYMASVIEYLTAELLELSGNAARDNKRKTISSRHIFLAVLNDDELSKLFEEVQISNSVVPGLHPSLMPKTKAKKVKKAKAKTSSSEKTKKTKKTKKAKAKASSSKTKKTNKKAKK